MAGVLEADACHVLQLYLFHLQLGLPTLLELILGVLAVAARGVLGLSALWLSLRLVVWLLAVGLVVCLLAVVPAITSTGPGAAGSETCPGVGGTTGCGGVGAAWPDICGAPGCNVCCAGSVGWGVCSGCSGIATACNGATNG